MATQQIKQITDHAEQAIDRLPSYQKLAANYGKLFRALFRSAQNLEDLLWDFLNKRAISTAEGKQLDNLGTYLDVGRFGGESDTSYRLRLQGAAANLASSGTPGVLIDTFGILTVANSVLLEEAYPASVILTAFVDNDVTLDDEIRDVMESTAAAGVALALQTQLTTQQFLWGDSANADSNGDLLPGSSGFGDSADTDANGDLDQSEGGGNLARAIP